MQERPDSLNDYANVEKMDVYGCVEGERTVSAAATAQQGEEAQELRLCALMLGVIHPNAEYHGCGRVDQAVGSFIDSNKFCKNW